MADQEWHQIVASVDRTSGRIYIYKDGIQQFNQSFSGSYEGCNWMSLGIEKQSSIYRFPFNGSIDEVALYDRALNDSEINEQFLLGNSSQPICEVLTQQGDAVPEVNSKILQIITLLAVALIVGIVILKRK